MRRSPTLLAKAEAVAPSCHVEGIGPLRLSVLVPCVNEARLIKACLDSIRVGLAASDVEVLVLDGGSDDGTVTIVREVAASDERVRLIDNPRGTAASAMNLGVQLASGNVIVRIDAHCSYPPNYVAELARALDTYQADVVGGVCDTRAREGTAMGIAIARVLTHPLGVGNAHFRIGSTEPMEVDTVPFGCWRRDILLAAGPFNEKLLRSQDYDMAGRLHAMGAKVVLLPDLTITYFARSGFREVFRYNVENGYWVTYPRLAYDVRFGYRHYAPLAAGVSGILLFVVAVLRTRKPLALVATTYGLLCVKVTIDRRPARADPPELWLALPVALASLHFAYAWGSLKGLCAGLNQRLRGRGISG